MWKSPIEIQQDIVRQVDMVVEDGVMKAIQRFDINVDKEELIKALKYDRDQYEKGYQDGLNANKWIPCSERLPKPFVKVLIFTDGGTFDVACMGYSYMDIYDIWKPVGGGYRKQENVIAWMPLPEPYKGE